MLAPALRRTTGADPIFQQLIPPLDADLAIRDGADHAFYARLNGSLTLAHAVVAAIDERPVGIGAFKVLAPDVIEIKRMFVAPAHRGHGIASRVLAELEAWARGLGATRARLETGVRQPEAIALYLKRGYQPIANYGPYVDVATSRCFEKLIA